MEWPCAAPVYLTKGYPDGRRATLERLVMGNNQASSEAQVLGRRRRATRVYQEGDIILVEEGGEAEQEEGREDGQEENEARDDSQLQEQGSQAQNYTPLQE